MKTYKIACVCFLIVVNTLLVQAQSASWKGTYSGKIDNVNATLVLNQEGRRVSGECDADGYRYLLSCDAEGNHCTGSVRDPQASVVLDMEMTRTGNSVAVIVKAVDEFGYVQAVTYTFNRGTAPVTKSKEGHAKGGNRDARLVGNWLYTDSYVSGDFSMTSQYRLIVNADGTYLYGDAKLAGGGNAGSVSSSGGGYTRGQWKTENGIIFINDGSGWQSYCKYYIENNSMMMTFENGKRQVWKRN